MIVQFWKRDAFSVAVELFVLLVVSHLRTLRATQHNPNLTHAATEAREGKKVRIFTVEEELPFAGHPTLGTALHLYASEFASNSKKSAEITLDLKAGKIPVRFTPDSENAGRDRVDGQVFGEMRQRDPEFRPALSREDVARVIGIAAETLQ